MEVGSATIAAHGGAVHEQPLVEVAAGPRGDGWVHAVLLCQQRHRRAGLQAPTQQGLRVSAVGLGRSVREAHALPFEKFPFGA